MMSSGILLVLLAKHGFGSKHDQHSSIAGSGLLTAPHAKDGRVRSSFSLSGLNGRHVLFPFLLLGSYRHSRIPVGAAPSPR